MRAPSGRGGTIGASLGRCASRRIARAAALALAAALGYVAGAAARPADITLEHAGPAQGRVYLPLVQHRAPANAVEDAGFERVARFPDLPLGGYGLGVPDTRNPAMDVGAGRAYLLGQDDSEGAPLITLAPGSSEGVRRHAMGLPADAIHVAGDRLFVLAWRTPTGDPDSPVIHAYDLADGDAPRPVGRLVVDEWPERHVATRGALYFTHNEKLFVVDGSDPSGLRKAGRVDVGFRPNDIAASDAGQVFLADETRIAIIDATDPDAPRRVGTLTGFEHLRAVRVTSDGAHLLAFDETFVRGFIVDGVLTVYDARQPDAPRPVGRLAIPSVFAWDAGLIRDFGPVFFALDGDRLAIAAHELMVVDLSARDAPRLVRRGHLPSRALGLGSDGGTIFVALEDGAVDVYRVRAMRGRAAGSSDPFLDGAPIITVGALHQARRPAPGWPRLASPAERLGWLRKAAGG